VLAKSSENRTLGAKFPVLLLIDIGTHDEVY